MKSKLFLLVVLMFGVTLSYSDVSPSHAPTKGPRPVKQAEKKPEATTVDFSHVESRTKSEATVLQKMGELSQDPDFMDGKKVIVVSTEGCVHCGTIKEDVIKSFMDKGLTQEEAKKRIIEVDFSLLEEKKKYMPLVGHLMIAGGYSNYSYPTTIYVSTNDKGEKALKFYPGNYKYSNPQKGIAGDPSFVSKAIKK